jgi:hypothetical protein
MHAVFALVAAVSAVRLAEGSSPVERVVGLLQDLKSQVESEGDAEAQTYDAFACFCKDTNNAKVNSIDSRTSSSESLSASKEQLTAQKASLTAEIAQLQTALSMHEASLAKATELRNKEHEVYMETHTDTSNAVSGLNDAMNSITGSKASLVEVKKKVSSLLALADAAGMTSPQLPALLQQIPEVPENDYDFHSQGIIDLLKDLHKNWSEKKATLEAEEDAASSAFNAAADAKRTEISTTKDTINTQTSALDTTNSDLATDTADLTETNALLADDKTYLKDLTEQCERKAREWDQRSSTRKGELEALTQALEILTTTVATKETESGAGMRPSLVQTPASTNFVQEPEQEDEEYSDVVFAQMKAIHAHKSGHAALRNKAITMLEKKGKDLKSSVLSMMAMKMAADPFAKVKTLIQQLIERLIREKTDEATHKGWCDTELAKAEHDRDYRHGDTESLSATVAVLEARKATLEETAATLKSDISALETAHMTTSKQRSAEKAENKATLDAAGEGLSALKNAIQVLKDFYKGATKPSSQRYLQVSETASPVDQDMAAAGTGVHHGAYTGNQAQAGGILGMLATIQSDFERTISETTAAEQAAHRDYVKFDIETKASLSSKNRGLEQTENDHKMTCADLVSALNDLQENQKLLDQSIETLETLRPACIDTGMSWDEKVARRTAEIDALKNAVCVLDEEDGEIAECNGKLFLQK